MTDLFVVGQTLIDSKRPRLRDQLGEAFRFRQLALFFVWRDIKVRYRQAAFGVAWAVLQPLAMMLVFTVVLGRLARVPSDGIPYPLFVYSTLVIWTFTSNGLSSASMSLIESVELVSKIFFPRILIPLARVASYLVDFVISCVLLIGLALFYGFTPSVSLLLIVPAAGLAFVLSSSIGLALAALNVRYRDVKHAVPFLLQVWLFLSPIVYPASLLPERLQWAYWLNPLAGIVELFRSSLLSTPPPPSNAILSSVAITVGVSILAVHYFQRAERGFADVI